MKRVLKKKTTSIKAAVEVHNEPAPEPQIEEEMPVEAPTSQLIVPAGSGGTFVSDGRGGLIRR